MLSFFTDKLTYNVGRWVEEDPLEILLSVKTCIDKAVENLKTLNVDPTCIKGLLHTREMSVLTDVKLLK